MRLRSYAKINLTLNVNKNTHSGLHNLQSIYCLINFFDKISIKKSKYKDKITFKGPYSKYVNSKKNTVKDILSIMRKYQLISNYYEIEILKKIPVFAGFGGGTSNAATILKFLTKNKIKKKIFNDIIKYIGSDLRLFSHEQGFAENLQIIKKLKRKMSLIFLLAYPRIKCSTKQIFSKVSKFSKDNNFRPSKFQKKRKFINYLVNSKNDLQSIVEKKYPSVRRLLKEINKLEGCFFSRMTGSGSACYGLFDDENSSKVALKKLRKKYPKFWFSIAKTI